ncbi:hypothetical protein PMI17_03656 [Pantoea sp. GM01]|nr:hypothetical protein PMI17_03656 [Pantoea sp. GM01]
MCALSLTLTLSRTREREPIVHILDTQNNSRRSKAARKFSPGSIVHYVTGVNFRSQRRYSAKYEAYQRFLRLRCISMDTAATMMMPLIMSCT